MVLLDEPVNLVSPSVMALVVLRSVFVLVAAGIGYQLIQADILPKEPAYVPWLAMGGMILLAVIVIAIDVHG